MRRLPRPYVTFEVRFEVEPMLDPEPASSKGNASAGHGRPILVRPIYSFHSVLVKQNLRVIVFSGDAAGWTHAFALSIFASP